jgi:hypothetical protein
MRFAYFGLLFSLLTITPSLAIPAQNLESAPDLVLDKRGGRWIIVFKQMPEPSTSTAIRLWIEKMGVSVGNIYRNDGGPPQLAVGVAIARTDLEEIQEYYEDIIEAINYQAY